MFGAIRRMFGGREGPEGAAASEEAAGDTIEYKGYHITPRPMRQGGGYLTSGTIVLDGPSGRREHRFVRADTHSSADEARQFTVLKAQRLIDEQGEGLFGP